MTKLDESFLEICMGCGQRFNAKGVYDFYCSKNCQERDEARIQKLVDAGTHPIQIMDEAIQKVKE